MSGHGLGGAHSQLIGVGTEHGFRRGGLPGIVEVGRGAVGVDVTHLLRRNAAVGQRHGHGFGAAAAVRKGGGDVVSVAGGAVAHHLGVDLRPAGLGVFQFLQKQHARALAHDEAAALRVKGNGGPVGVLRLGQGLHGGEAADGHGRDGGLGAAAEHDLGVAVPNVVESVAHGVGTSGAGGDGAGAHGPEARVDGHLTRRHVADGGGDIEGGYPVKALFLTPAVLRLGDGLSADAAGEDHTAAVRIRLLHGETGVGQGLPGRRHGELGETAHTLGFLTAQQGLRVEALYLCRQLHLLGGGIVMGDGADAAHAVFHGLPAFSRRQSNGGHSPQTGDNNSASFHVAFLLTYSCRRQRPKPAR